jgi:pimeloyl-ACP methyl ester carboxylesterase
MGADARLFEPQRCLNADIDVPSWLPPDHRESFASYARRVAKSLDVSRPFVLGGVSFGGMLAWEIAQHVPGGQLRGVLLISTCRSNRGVPRAFRIAGRCAAALPSAMFRVAKSTAPLARKMMGIITRDQATLFDEMLRDADPHFLRWSLWALLRWPGPQRTVNVPVLELHGVNDRILPCRLCRPDHVIPNAGHLMNVTHAAEVNRLIAQWLPHVP